MSYSSERISFLALALNLICFSATGTWAQVTSGSQAPGERPREAPITKAGDERGGIKQDDDSDKSVDAFQPKGIELGKFLLLPKTELDESYNSNIFATTSNAKSDYITRLAPQFDLRSRFARHELNFNAKLEQFWHNDFKSDDHTDYTLSAIGRLDVDKTDELNGSFTTVRGIEDRGSPNDVSGRTPTVTNFYLTTIGAKDDFGRYKLKTDFSVNRYEYDAVSTALGTIVNNPLRDRWEYVGVARGAYEIFPGYDAVFQVTGNGRVYDTRLDSAGYARSSNGYRIESGVGVDIAQVLRGDFVIGYLSQTYDDPRLQSINGVSFKASFNWTPSRLTLVVPYFERSVDETITSKVSGLLNNTVGVTVRHELERNILLFGSFSASYTDYIGTPQTSSFYDVKGRATYLFTRELYAAVEVEYKTRDYKLTTLPSFNQFIGTLRAGVRY